MPGCIRDMLHCPSVIMSLSLVNRLQECHLGYAGKSGKAAAHLTSRCLRIALWTDSFEVPALRLGSRGAVEVRLE